jgi:hypothetical protein
LWSYGLEMVTAKSQRLTAIAVGKQPGVADLHEATRQNVKQKATDELDRIEAHDLDAVVVSGVARIVVHMPYRLRERDLRCGGSAPIKMARFERFEYSVTTKGAPQMAWEVFSDWTLWPQFSELYSEIRWTKGERWQEGSRLSIKAVEPIGVTLDHVITMCVPGEKVAWTDHALGSAMEQWVFFKPEPGGTRVRTWAEFTGMMPLVAGRRMKEVLLEFTRTWYNRYAMECDRVAGASSTPTSPQRQLLQNLDSTN